jgi:twitching motility protein PilJ
MSKRQHRGSIGQSFLMILLTSLLIASLAFVGLTFFLLTNSASNEQQWIQAATTVQVSSQQFSKAAGEAAAGNLDAFTELASARTRIANAMNQLENGSPGDDLPASPGATAPTRAPVSITWKQMNANSLAILERKDLILEIASANVSFAKIIPQVLQNTDQTLQQLTKSGAPTQQVYIAGRQLVLADRMLRRVSEVLQGGSGAIAAAENLGRELKSFDQVLSALLNGNQGIPRHCLPWVKPGNCLTRRDHTSRPSSIPPLSCLNCVAQRMKSCWTVAIFLTRQQP